MLPFTIDELKKAVEAKLVTERKHPTADLYIYNYTPLVQYSRAWNEVTLNCRGLILDGAGNIVARPFRKFFNYEEYQNPEMPPLPLHLPYTVMDKMDGSLGILYHDGNDYAIATRGSFESDQAIKATEILRTKYRDFKVNDRHTWLFEIIYPSNRIVVDYGDIEDLILLDVIENHTGTSLPVNHVPFPVVARFDDHKLDQLLGINRDNSEGFVVKFDDGTRVKIKHAEYVRLHRLLTEVSSKSIWEILKNGEKITEILDRVPDEFYQWVRTTEKGLRDNHAHMLAVAKTMVKDLADLERKEVAMRIKGVDQPYPAIIFALLDGKDQVASDVIWKHLKPAYEKPFAKDIDV
jgi:RNA ligase